MSKRGNLQALAQLGALCVFLLARSADAKCEAV